ncbi:MULTISPECIES: hypothetical protein [unclassified Streptomyces]|uniref:hypothetical protein n=2 Tax=unclassified Streptomyces TaxID=2593676 RepID=UPI0022582BD9|nr:hypothetical protein [Streptomyces sp. NBC_00892]MCX4894009.1 hypothetical protein [Streptomyces sp. NBC_00892]WTB58582.1 hypothetical protein OG832_38220 [Streptomyces sp. NBC_00826]
MAAPTARSCCVADVALWRALMDRTVYAESFVEHRDGETPETLRWLPVMYRAAAARLEKLEREAEQRYPGIFERLDTERVAVGAAVPSWCWLPVARVREVLAHHCTSNGTGIEGTSPTAQRSVDAARLASIGAWRAAGRHMVHPDDDLIPWPHEAECDGGDEMPVGLPGRWPLFGLYVVFLSPNPAVLAEGGFLHLEWDEREQRAALRIAPDTEPVAGLGRLDAQPLHLVGETTLEAARKTVRAVPSDTVLAASSDSELDRSAMLLAGKNRFWVRAADRLTSPHVNFVDAAQALGRAPGALWPPEQPDAKGGAPLLWLAMSANA